MIEFLAFLAQCAVIFVLSTTLFDGVHFLLHRWQRSRFRLLRLFSSWHQVHHDFLDKNMKIHPEFATRNLWAHLLPEFLTSLAGTAGFFFLAPLPTVAICVLHVVLMMGRLVKEGMDFNHMAMSRVSGRRGVLLVDPAYHAMHHINPMGFYSSFLNVFDMIFGTALALRGKRVLLTGASGAYGSEMMAALRQAGANVVKFPLREITGNIDTVARWQLRHFDLLVMCHGLKESQDASEVWLANFHLTAFLGDEFIRARAGDLVPSEIWCVGSEAEVVGISDYAMSKRKMADYAAEHWFHSPDVTYRHIVPSAFRSKMGWGLMSAGFAVAVSLFLIRRGFRYIPVTYTGIAFVNRLRFLRIGQRKPTTRTA